MIAYPTTTAAAPVDASTFNSIYFGAGGFETKLSKMLGGLDFALAFPGAVPPQLLGFCFFFLAGPAIYARKFPGFVAKTLTVHDPVVVADVPCAGGASYDHTVFTNAANAMTFSSQDDTNHIVNVNAAFHGNGIGALDGSMEAHTRLLTPAGGSTQELYFLQELPSMPNPERIHDFAVSEIILEGQTDVTLPEGTVPKYRCQRLRNYNPIAATVRANGYTISIPAFSCVTVRRDWDAANRRMINPRFGKYFWRWEKGDPLMFQNYANSRPGGFGDPLAVSATAITPAGAIQANNLTNAALLHDFKLQLSQDGNFCQFISDPTELCDLTQL